MTLDRHELGWWELRGINSKNKCGHKDRDIDAAINIKKFYLQDQNRVPLQKIQKKYVNL
jgi:transposase